MWHCPPGAAHEVPLPPGRGVMFHNHRRGPHLCSSEIFRIFLVNMFWLSNYATGTQSPKSKNRLHRCNLIIHSRFFYFVLCYNVTHNSTKPRFFIPFQCRIFETHICIAMTKRDVSHGTKQLRKSPLAAFGSSVFHESLLFKYFFGSDQKKYFST